MKNLPPSLSYIILLGTVLVIFGGQFYIAEPTPVLCALRVLFAPAGAGISLSLLVLMMYRQHHAFENTLAKNLTNTNIILGAVSIGAIQLLCVGIISGVVQSKPETGILNDGTEYRICTPSDGRKYLYVSMEAAALGVNGFLMLLCLYYAFLTRNIKRELSYSKSVATSVSIAAIVTIFGIAVAIKEEQEPETLSIAVLLRSLVYVFAAMLIALVLLVPRLLDAIFDYKTDEHAAEEDIGRKGGIDLTSEWEGEQKGFTSFVFLAKILGKGVEPSRSSSVVVVPEMDVLVLFENLTNARVSKAFKLSDISYTFPNVGAIPIGTKEEKEAAVRVVLEPLGKGGKAEAVTIEFPSLERMQAFGAVLEAAAVRMAVMKNGRDSKGTKKGTISDAEFLRSVEVRQAENRSRAKSVGIRRDTSGLLKGQGGSPVSSTP
ncbi:hypothetical protein HDV00_012311 [Rhizophlyctis rosea]|nr:hypothetical protein HDV00_012311 [Rhizophlyctis rosea]